MPLTYSIANGIGIGAIAYTLIAIFSGKYTKKDIIVTIISILFILKFIFITMEFDLNGLSPRKISGGFLLSVSYCVDGFLRGDTFNGYITCKKCRKHTHAKKEQYLTYAE